MIIEIIFINEDVLKKLLKGLKINRIIIVIEAAVHIHILFVPSVNMFKFDGGSELI
jgi:hypothetical protein